MERTFHSIIYGNDRETRYYAYPPLSFTSRLRKCSITHYALRITHYALIFVYMRKMLYLCEKLRNGKTMGKAQAADKAKKKETAQAPQAVYEGIYKDRGSRFLAFAEPIADEEQAKARVAWYKKKYHDARHVCYAYRLGENLWRTKDDGEPHGTAGVPILRSIDARGLDNILVVVVRYFGGTLLGTGGLMVAYREASKDALEKCVMRNA